MILLRCCFQVTDARRTGDPRRSSKVLARAAVGGNSGGLVAVAAILLPLWLRRRLLLLLLVSLAKNRYPLPEARLPLLLLLLLMMMFDVLVARAPVQVWLVKIVNTRAVAGFAARLVCQKGRSLGGRVFLASAP
jgi:hypothetical protein